MKVQPVRPIPCTRHAENAGIALVLVMLLMLVLTTLAATIVFTANSETFASHNYRLDTEADYVAKAGIQAAMNWFRSSGYMAVSNTQASTYYNVVSDGSLWNLYKSQTTPVNCVSSSGSKCPSQNSPVRLISYGGGSSNYPADINNSLSTLVTSNFQSSLKDVPVTTGDPANKGAFCVNAYLLSYQTVNCPTCATNPAPMETWLITSTGTWGSSTSCTSGVVATAEEQAIVQPIYRATWGNAMYGYCGVSMSGSSGDCTDAFNSALGAYGGGNPSVAVGACDSNSTNVIDSGAGVGGNGYVNLSNNVTVSGDATIGNVNYTPPSSCCTAASNPPCGFSGNLGAVQGAVVSAPPVAVPGVPTFPTGLPVSFPTGPPAAASYNATITLPQNALGGTPSAPITPGVGNPYINPCMLLAVCNGSASNPYLINSVSLTGGSSNVVTLYGGPNIFSPAYYDIDTLNESGQGSITIEGYVVLNVRTNLSITGQGIANPLSTEPEALQIKYAGTNTVSLGGNGAMSAIVTAPLATVNLGGGGSKGYIVGAIQANVVNTQGGYPLHYDIQLNRLEGTMGQMVVSSYSRIKQ